MPAATPLPRGPSVLTLYSAADLLTAPGCPVCRYADEASDRYFGWFALEGHAEPGAITTLCGSLGMCARHTRRLMSQPGAAIRLTAVYRYVVAAARDRVAGRGAAVAPCPACEHHDAAAGRALETLLDGLADGEALDRYRELGGLCVPHLATAASEAPRRILAWLSGTLRETMTAHRGRPEWLAGSDHDAEMRAALRHSVPDASAAVPGACAACLAAAQAERKGMAQLLPPAGVSPDAQPVLSLCAAHLADAAAARPGPDGLLALLTWQAPWLALEGRLRTGRSRWLRGGPGRGSSAGCPICRTASDAARRVLGGVRGAWHEQPQGSHRGQTLCVRHHLALRAADQRTGQALAGRVVEAADLLVRDLSEEFERTTWVRHHGAPGPDPAVWRRAAVFLDGAVSGGRPSP